MRRSTRDSPAGDELMENFCQENNQFGIAGGHTHPFAGSAAKSRKAGRSANAARAAVALRR
jgi:hypothetical protein